MLSAEAFSLGPHMLSSYSSGLSSLDTKGSESLLFLLGPHLYHTTNLTGLLESQIPNAVIWMVNLSTLGFGRDTRESRTCQSYSTVYVCVVFLFGWFLSFLSCCNRISDKNNLKEQSFLFFVFDLSFCFFCFVLFLFVFLTTICRYFPSWWGGHGNSNMR